MILIFLEFVWWRPPGEIIEPPDDMLSFSEKCHVCGQRSLDDAYSIRCCICQLIFHRNDLVYSQATWCCQDDLREHLLKLPCNPKGARDIDAFSTFHWLLSNAEPPLRPVYNKQGIDSSLHSLVGRVLADSCLEQVCNWCREALEKDLEESMDDALEMEGEETLPE